MNTKTCKNCGWVYPLVTPYSSCRFCGRGFTEGICAKCGTHSQDIIVPTNLCRSCYNERNRKYQKRVVHTTEERMRYYKRLCAEADEQFAKWLETLKSIKTHTLTEDEWLEACKHFGGCAACNSESIDARGYFIRFEDGGKYNACNVIPLCEKCATAFKKQPNPFRQMHPQINRNLIANRGMSLDKLHNIVDYLQSKIGGIVDEEQS